MKKYKPYKQTPDKDIEVLAYYGKEIGFVVATYNNKLWAEAWNDNIIADTPEYWVDLTDIENSLK